MASFSRDPGLRSCNSQAKEVKVQSMREAITMLEDLTEYRTSGNLTEAANNHTRVLSNLQFTWLCCKLKASGQREANDFFK